MCRYRSIDSAGVVTNYESTLTIKDFNTSSAVEITGFSEVIDIPIRAINNTTDEITHILDSTFKTDVNETDYNIQYIPARVYNIGKCTQATFKIDETRKTVTL